MKNSRVSLLVTLVLLGSFAFAQKQTVTWKEYVFVNDGYAITLPEAPNPHPDSTLPEMTVYSVSVQPNTRLSLRVSHQDRDCGATLAQLKGGALKGNSGIDPASVTDVYVDGHPGVEYRYRLVSGRISSDRFYCVNGNFYAFSFSWPSTEPLPTPAIRALSSFRLL